MSNAMRWADPLLHPSPTQSYPEDAARQEDRLMDQARGALQPWRASRPRQRMVASRCDWSKRGALYWKVAEQTMARKLEAIFH